MDRFTSRLVGKFEQSAKKISINELNGSLWAPNLCEIRLMEEKKPKKVFSLHTAESFAVKPGEQVLALPELTYSDDAKEQVERAIAGKSAADNYDFKLQH